MSDDKEKAYAVTDDRHGGAEFEEIVRSMDELPDDKDAMYINTTSGMVRIRDAEHLHEVVMAGQREFEAFVKLAPHVLTPEIAYALKAMRVAEHSWRQIAAKVYMMHETKLKGLVEPPNNQLFGMALCKVAAQHLGDDPTEAPWA